MNCPVCNQSLMMTERQGVEIDYCPKCRGVWLDRGELDKIIERSAGTPPYQSKSDYKQHDDRHDDRHRDDHSKDYKYGYSKDYKKKKRESFLSDLFDF